MSELYLLLKEVRPINLDISSSLNKRLYKETGHKELHVKDRNKITRLNFYASGI